MTNLPEKLITVPLKDLRPFDMTPRITRNPDYEKIKDSIRLRQLEPPPHITQARVRRLRRDPGNKP